MINIGSHQLTARMRARSWSLSSASPLLWSTRRAVAGRWRGAISGTTPTTWATTPAPTLSVSRAH